MRYTLNEKCLMSLWLKLKSEIEKMPPRKELAMSDRYKVTVFQRENKTVLKTPSNDQLMAEC